MYPLPGFNDRPKPDLTLITVTTNLIFLYRHQKQLSMVRIHARNRSYIPVMGELPGIKKLLMARSLPYFSYLKLNISIYQSLFPLKKMRCLIVDDNDMARLMLSQLVTQTGLLEVIGECRDAMEAHQQITRHAPDLVFLDIEMPGMSGIELLRSLPKKPLIIFTTSNKDYALEAF